MSEVSSAAGTPAPTAACIDGSTPQAAARSAASAALALAYADIDRLVDKVPEMFRGKIREALRRRVATAWTFQVARSKAAGAGYAKPSASAARKTVAVQARPKSATTTAASAGAPAATAATTGSTRGEWGFLNDAHTSIEDKLFLFMSKVQKKNDDVLAAKMREYRDQFVDKKSGGGLLASVASAVKSVVPGSGVLLDALEQGLKSLGGPLLGALVSALGLPQLAPLALKLGADAGAFVASQIDSKSSSTSTTSASADEKTGSPDEKLAMLELQRLVEKQNQMFNCISNILRNLHETGMNTIGNIR